jgi:hypothetical protein
MFFQRYDKRLSLFHVNVSQVIFNPLENLLPGSQRVLATFWQINCRVSKVIGNTYQEEYFTDWLPTPLINCQMVLITLWSS